MKFLMSANRFLPCTLSEFDAIIKQLEKDEAEADEVGKCNLEFRHDGKFLFIIGTECPVLENVSEKVIKKIADLIKKANRKYLQFSYVVVRDEENPGYVCGGETRIYADGSIVDPQIIWPD
jgi:hypothetical protein